MKKLVYLVFVAIGLGCVPESDFDTIAYEPKLVIDGAIESGGFPTVVLSKSASYFMNIDSSNIRDLFMSTAKVTVSNGVDSEVLTLKRDNTAFPPYRYVGTNLKGESGKTYTLTVEADGERYTSTTTIPDPPTLDKLWFELSPGMDSLGYVYAGFTDPAEETNYYRIFTQRLQKDTRFIPVYLSATGDQYFNGQQFTFTILRGPENYLDIIDDLYFKKGDSVRIKLCSMDKAHFDFWRTVERELYVTGNPFSSSGNKIISNIEGEKALGVWGGYGVSFYAINIK
jgi:hypothetical protein